MDEIIISVPIVDDLINEADEQYFVLTLEVVDATNASRIIIVQQNSLCRIIDDDCESVLTNVFFIVKAL